MTDSSTPDPETTAVEQLEQIGLSLYAARTFVALVRLGSGTAKDVSDVAEVPRTRVYDAAEELHDRGLVDVRQSNPRQFWPISAETTGRKFEQEFEHRIDALTEALDDIERVERTEEQRGVWTVQGKSAVTDRVVEFLKSAEGEVVFTTDGSLLTDETVEALRAASDRGVTVRIGGLSDDVRDRIQGTVPEAELFETLWVWSELPAGRLLMVDGAKTLASVVSDDAPTDGLAETAIWGTGESNSLVVVLKALFAWRLDEGNYSD